MAVARAHDPVREYGFLGVVVDTTNLEGSIWTWWREDGKFHARKTVTIPPEPAEKDQLPPLLQGFGAVPPLVTDIDFRPMPKRREPQRAERARSTEDVQDPVLDEMSRRSISGPTIKWR